VAFRHGTVLVKIFADLADTTVPLRQRMKAGHGWERTPVHQEAFDATKRLLTSDRSLRYFDPKEDLEICCDASDKGLRAALLQGQPIAFASRSLTDTERRYAVLDKELLAVAKFCQYTFGNHTHVYSDHKPLECIILKALKDRRLQNMRMRLQQYVAYRPGKVQYLADSLSRAPCFDMPVQTVLDEQVVTIHHVIMAQRCRDDIASETRRDKSTGPGYSRTDRMSRKQREFTRRGTVILQLS